MSTSHLTDDIVDIQQKTIVLRKTITDFLFFLDKMQDRLQNCIDKSTSSKINNKRVVNVKQAELSPCVCAESFLDMDGYEFEENDFIF